MGRAHQRDAILLSAKSGVPHILRAAALAALAALASAGTMHAAHAADMAMPQPFEPQQDDDQRVLFGTGWYIRGDLGIAKDIKLQVGNLTTPKTSNLANSWALGLGAGYKYNQWFRSDVTADYRAPRRYEGNTVAYTPCQTGTDPVYQYNTVDVYTFDPVSNALVKTGTTTTQLLKGSTPAYSSCSDYSRARMTNFHVLFNSYVDLGNWGGFTPYVGAGAGFNIVYQKASQQWFMSNGNAYNPTWTDVYSNNVYSAYWDKTRSSKNVQFAWALMGGVSYALNSNATIDLGYRYLNLGTITNYSGPTSTSVQKNTAQEVRLGVRYAPD